MEEECGVGGVFMEFGVGCQEIGRELGWVGYLGKSERSSPEWLGCRRKGFEPAIHRLPRLCHRPPRVLLL